MPHQGDDERTTAPPGDTAAGCAGEAIATAYVAPLVALAGLQLHDSLVRSRCEGSSETFCGFEESILILVGVVLGAVVLGTAVALYRGRSGRQDDP